MRAKVSPMQRGMASAVGAIAFLGVALTVCFNWLGSPSAELMLAVGGAGVGLLVAYSVAVAGGEAVLSRQGSRDQHESWLGFVTGTGICGLIGIAAAFAVSASREAGHGGLLAELGTWWSAASIGMLGIVVAIHPILAYEWRRSD